MMKATGCQIKAVQCHFIFKQQLDFCQQIYSFTGLILYSFPGCVSNSMTEASLGRIGTAMTLRCKAFGMDVCFYDPYKSNGSDLALGIRRADSLEELFAESDVVSIHVPLTAETRNMIDAAVLAAAKPGLVLINAARGEVVDIDALYDALKSDRIGGAGLDVLPEEPADPDRPLIAAWASGEEWIADRVIVTPHAAFYTPQSLYDMRTRGITVALKYLRTGRLENCVNQEFLAEARSVPVS